MNAAEWVVRLAVTPLGARFDRWCVRFADHSPVSWIFARSEGVAYNPPLLLTTPGRKTGRNRTVVLPWFEAGAGRIAVVGSKGGAPADPHWAANLRANPDAHVHLRRRRQAVTTHVAEGAERERLWNAITDRSPVYLAYQEAAREHREIPVFVISPKNEPLRTRPRPGRLTSGVARSQMLGEERQHPPPAVLRRLLVIADPHRTEGPERRDPALRGTHVTVAGTGIDHDVARYVESRQVIAQTARRRSEHAVAAAEAPNHRRDTAQRLTLLRNIAIVGGDDGELGARTVQHREAAAHAEADRADAIRIHPGLGPQETLGGREDVECPTGLRTRRIPELGHGPQDAERPDAGSEEIDGQSGISGRGQAPCDAVHVSVRAEDLVEHEHPRTRLRSGGPGEPAGPLPSRTERERDILQIDARFDTHVRIITGRPRTVDALHTLPAWKLAEAVRAGHCSARESVEHHLARIAAHDGALGSFVFLDEARALAAADTLDGEIARGRAVGPLAGVPFGVKCLEDVRGWPHTMAAKVFADRVATTTSTQVTRLEAAGAIAVGLTASPEMGSASHTASLLYGVCRNPWNPALTPGGSSGGSAAAVAAGLVPMATGSDSGGSLRIPAAYCGVFGFKGTYGRIPRGPNYVGLPNIRNYGVISRTVRDAALALDSTAGADEHDPLSLPKPAESFVSALGIADARETRVAWTRELGFGLCDDAVADAARRAASKLIGAAGWVEVPIPVALPDPERAWQVLGAPDVVGAYGPFLQDRADEIAPFIRTIAERGAQLTSADFGEAAQVRDALVHALASVFDQVDFLMLPTVACPAFAAEGPSPAAIAGEPVSLLRSVAQTYVFNLSGHPAASLPIGQVGGTPVGLQIVARRHDDARLLSAAAAWESIAPWPALAPGFD